MGRFSQASTLSCYKFMPRGIYPGNKGKKLSEETRKKMSKAKKGIIPANIKSLYTEELNKRRSEKESGEKHWNWKGDKVGYHALHDWIVKIKGKAKECSLCGLKVKKRYHWHNIDNKYSRNPNDYKSLCPKCHKKVHKLINKKNARKYSRGFYKTRSGYNNKT